MNKVRSKQGCKEIWDWCQKKKHVSFWVSRCFCLWGGLIQENAEAPCTLEGRGEAQSTETHFTLHIFLPCLHTCILFHFIFRFSCHGTTCLGPPHPPNLPLGEELLLPPSKGVRGSREGPSPPLPHSSAALGPLPCWHWDAGLGALWLRVKEEEGLGWLPGPQLLKSAADLNACTCTHTHTHTHTSGGLRG